MTAPILIRVLPGLVTHNHRDLLYRSFILAFTFLCYTSYHLSRKPISVVKSVLHRDNCSSVKHSKFINTSDQYWCDWPPFDGSNGLDLLGTLDLCYLISYAVAMFLSGHIADRMNLRYYLSAGMILSSIFTIAFGLGYFFDIHSFSFYVIIQVIGGTFQATGWPGVVACIGNWFGKGKRGLIMGIWNAHTSVGNILGSIIAGAFVEDNWGLSFVVPGIFIGVVGILVFLFLVPHPQDVDCKLPDHSDSPIPDLSPGTSINSVQDHPAGPSINSVQDHPAGPSINSVQDHPAGPSINSVQEDQTVAPVNYGAGGMEAPKVSLCDLYSLLGDAHM